MMSLKNLGMDCQKAKEKICSFISKQVEESGASGVVLGLSGGIDSTLCAYLSASALGRQKVLGLILPSEYTSRQDIEDAEGIAESLEIDSATISIKPMLEAYAEHIPNFENHPLMPKANLQARIRMSLIYYHANLEKKLVVGTGNRSELMQGYFTKYGDGAVDLLPIGSLYKTQVRQLASFMGVPKKIMDKTPTAGLWTGQKDEEELGITYPDLDLILYAYLDKKMKPEKIAKETGLGPALVEKVIGRIKASEHKRAKTPIAEL